MVPLPSHAPLMIYHRRARRGAAGRCFSDWPASRRGGGARSGGAARLYTYSHLPYSGTRHAASAQPPKAGKINLRQCNTKRRRHSADCTCTWSICERTWRRHVAAGTWRGRRCAWLPVRRPHHLSRARVDKVCGNVGPRGRQGSPAGVTVTGTGGMRLDLTSHRAVC